MENKKHKYISRYEKEKGGSYTFCGWRLCITRNKERYVRYFSDRRFNGAQAALIAALAERDEMLADLASGRISDTSEYFSSQRRKATTK